MRPACAFYFLYDASLAAIMPYLTIYCASRGLSRLEIGILMSLFALVTMFGAPFWTEIADATGRIGRYGYRSSGSCWPPPAASRATHMVPLALFTVLLAFHLAPAMPLLEPAVLEALGDRAHAYGRWRVRGALGWAVAAPAAGWATSAFRLPWAFYPFLAFMPWVALVAARMPYAASTGTRRIGGA